MIRVELIMPGSDLYWASIELRRTVLRIPLNLDFTQADFDADLGDFHFAAIDGQVVVGTLILQPLDDSAVKMRQVAVAETHRGRGIGRELVNAAEEFAWQEGYELIKLSARESVVAFYAGLGYSAVGSPFEEVSLPHVRMLKNRPTTML